MITVYTKSHCVQCNAVKRWLDQRGVEYETRDLTEDVDKLMEFRDAGHTQAPVVVSDHRPTFTGFNPEALAELVE